MELTPEQVRDWLVASCVGQEVPIAITDPVTVQAVATLLVGGDPAEPGARDGAPGAVGASPTAASPA